MTPPQALFALLWLTGIAGELTVLWIDLPIPPEALPFPLPIVKLLGLLQSTVILSIAVGMGVALASPVGLSAPFLEAIAKGAGQPSHALKRQILPGLIGGLLSVGLVLAWFALLRSALPPAFLAAGADFAVPGLTRILRGGITEEIVMRWGLMTLLVWLPWRMLQKRRGRPHPAYFMIAIGLAALVFGLLHLPVAFLLSPEVTASLVVYVIVGNVWVGAIAGYLYWQTGLEAAIVAHSCFHIILLAIQSLGWLTGV